MNRLSAVAMVSLFLFGGAVLSDVEGHGWKYWKCKKKLKTVEVEVETWFDADLNVCVDEVKVVRHKNLHRINRLTPAKHRDGCAAHGLNVADGVVNDTIVAATKDVGCLDEFPHLWYSSACVHAAQDTHMTT